MAVQVPPEVNWLLDILCGQSWPEGDEDALRRCAQAWQEAAQGLGDLAGYLDSSAQHVLASADSMSADDYDNFWKTYIHDGDGTYVALFKQCEPLVKQLFAQATEVEYTKIVIVVTLILTAIQIAIAIAAAAGTFGGSLAEVGLAMFIGRQTILMVVARFVEMALMMLIPDLVAQTVMFAQGHGWDWSKTGTAFENALVAGTIAAALGPLAGKLPWMSEEAAQTIGGKLGALATHFVEGGAVNDLTSLATMGANYGLASLTGNKDWQQQIGQQWSSTNWVAQFAQGGVLADAFYFPHMFGHDGVPMTFTGSDGKSYTVYLDDAAFTSLRDTGQLPADYQARVFGENGVKVGDATFNGTTISFDKPINGQSAADLGDGFSVAGHDGSQFRFQPSDQTGPDDQPLYDLVSRVQKSTDPITVPNADPGGDPLDFPPGSVVHYDNVPGPDGTMTGQPYRVEVTEGNVVKIYQAEQPGGPFELTGQVVHSNGILRFFGADAPKYYGPDGQGDGANPLASVSLITGKSTTNDLPGYLNAHVDRWAPGAPANAADPRIVDGTVVTPANDGQQAGQEADSATAVGLADASAFVYAQQVQQLLQSHPDLFAELVSRGGSSPAPEVPEEPHQWPQLFLTADRRINVPEGLNGLVETDVAERLAQSREAYENARQSLELQYRQDIQGYEKADTSVHTLEKLNQERSERTAKYQADLQELADEYQAADRKILTEELQQVRTYLEPLKEEIAPVRATLDELTRRIEAMRREGGHSDQEFRDAEQERQQVLARRDDLRSVSERLSLLAETEKRITGALRNLGDEYSRQMADIKAGLDQELAQRPHLDLDRIYAAELVRLDRAWAHAETLPEAERLRRFGELQRQLRDLEVGLSRQHEALRIGPDAERARAWVRKAFNDALKENRARGVLKAEATARDQVVKSIDDRAAGLESRIDRLIKSTGPGRELSPEVGYIRREVAELRRLRDIVQADPAPSGSEPLYPVSRSTIAQVAVDPVVDDAVREVLAKLPPVPGTGRDVHAAYEMVIGGSKMGPFQVESGTAVPDAESRWVRNAAGGVLNYLQEHGGVPGDLHVGSLADRRTDAEFQIVAQVRARLEDLRAGEIEPTGVVVIGADKLMCPSCQMALHELMGEFPGINVVLASGTVTVILDPHMADVRPLSDVYGPRYDLRADVVPLDSSAADMSQVTGGAKFFEPARLRTDVPPELDLGALARHPDGLVDAALDAPEYHDDYEMIIKISKALAERAQATERTQAVVLDGAGQPHWVEGGPHGFADAPGKVVAVADGVLEADYARPVMADNPPDLHAALDGPGDQAALSDLAAQLRARAAATGRVQAIVRDETGELRWVEGGRIGILALPEPGLEPGRVILLADDPRQAIVVQTAWTDVNSTDAARQFPPEEFNERLVIPPTGDAIRLTPVARDDAGTEPLPSWRGDVVSRSIGELLNFSPNPAEAPTGFSHVDLPADLARLTGLVHKVQDQDRVVGYAASDKTMIDLVRQMPGVKGAFLVDMHGGADGPWDPSSPELQSPLSWRDVRDLLVAAGWDGKQPVVLMSCDTAQGSFAADLAAKLGVRVIAPTARVWQVGDRVFIFEVDPLTGRPDWSKPGHWEEFGGENPGPVATDEHGMPVLDASHPTAVKADEQQVTIALRALSDPAHAPPVSRGEDELPKVTNDPGLVSATGEVVLTSAIDGTRPWVLEVGGHCDWLGPAAPVDVEPSDAAWPNIFSYGDAQVRLDLVRWPGRMDAVVVGNAADIAERIEGLGTALRPGGLLVLDHGQTRALTDEGSPLSIWVRASAKDVPEGYERVYSGPDRIVLRKLGGGITGEQPPAEPDIGRFIAAMASQHEEVPSLFPSPREIEERWGITQRNQKLIQWIADKEDAVLLMRPGNSESAPMQEAGGVTKPPALKANTINEIDVVLGAQDLVGAVGFYQPVKPDEAAQVQLEQAGLWDAVRKRYDRRFEQYNELLPKIEHLILERKFRVVDGVIYPFDPVPASREGGIYGTLRVGEPELDEQGRLVAPVFADGPGDARMEPVNLWPKFNQTLGVPVTGDYDMYQVLDAAGEELPFERPQVPAGAVEPSLWFKKLVDEGFMTQDQIRGKGADAGELLARQMGIQHGAMLVFLRHNEITDWERQNIYEPIIKGHQVGGTPLLLFQAGRRPTLVYPEPVPADLSRSLILDALNPPGGHQNWLAAVHGPDLLPTHLTIDPADVPADLTPLTPPTGLGDLAGMVYARIDGNGVVISSDPEHLAAAAAGAEDDAFRLYAVGGGGQAWAPGGRDLSPQELLTLAKAAGWDGSRPLELVVCQGGAGDGASLAARVQAVARSEFPDAVVRGATDWVWQDPATGERVVAPGLWDPATGHFLPHPQRRGTWVRFPPDDSVAGAPEDHQPAAHWVHWADEESEIPPSERPLKILAFITMWDPNAGGVVAVNRQLCEALAAEGHDVYVRVGHPPPDIRIDGIQLIGPRVFDPKIDSRYQLGGDYEKLPGQVDAVIGHTRFSGPAAQQTRDDVYPGAQLVHFVHMAPEALGRVQLKPPDEVAKNVRIERDLVAHADLAVGVGPRLAEEARNLAQQGSVDGHMPVIHELTPGVEIVDREPHTGQDPLKIIYLRGRADDTQKGTIQAAEMVRSLGPENARLIVRGVPEKLVEDQKQLLENIAGAPVEVRPYSIDKAELVSDLQEADVLVMPSRAEGFGLVVLEAAGAGVPVLAPNTSGAGMYLADPARFPADLTEHSLVEQSFTEPVPVARWTDQLKAILDDLPAAQQRALDIQRRLRDADVTWRAAGRSLVEEIRQLEPRPDPAPQRRQSIVDALRVEIAAPGEHGHIADGPATHDPPPHFATIERVIHAGDHLLVEIRDGQRSTTIRVDVNVAARRAVVSSLDPNGAWLRDMASRAQTPDGLFDLFGHADEYGFVTGGMHVAFSDLKPHLPELPDDTIIRLCGCESGRGDAVVALAAATQRIVRVTDKPVFTDTQGNVFACTAQEGADGLIRLVPDRNGQADGMWEDVHPDGHRDNPVQDGFPVTSVLTDGDTVLRLAPGDYFREVTIFGPETKTDLHLPPQVRDFAGDSGYPGPGPGSLVAHDGVAYDQERLAAVNVRLMGFAEGAIGDGARWIRIYFDGDPRARNDYRSVLKAIADSRAERLAAKAEYQRQGLSRRASAAELRGEGPDIREPGHFIAEVAVMHDNVYLSADGQKWGRVPFELERVKLHGIPVEAQYLRGRDAAHMYVKSFPDRGGYPEIARRLEDYRATYSGGNPRRAAEFDQRYADAMLELVRGDRTPSADGYPDLLQELSRGNEAKQAFAEITKIGLQDAHCLPLHELAMDTFGLPKYMEFYRRIMEPRPVEAFRETEVGKFLQEAASLTVLNIGLEGARHPENFFTGLMTWHLVARGLFSIDDALGHFNVMGPQGAGLISRWADWLNGWTYDGHPGSRSGWSSDPPAKYVNGIPEPPDSLPAAAEEMRRREREIVALYAQSGDRDLLGPLNQAFFGNGLPADPQVRERLQMEALRSLIDYLFTHDMRWPPSLELFTPPEQS